MKFQLSCASFILLGCLLCFVSAEQKPEGEKAAEGKAAKTKAAKETVSPEEMIRETAKKFQADFNQGNSKVVAAYWTTDGEYIDEAGERFVGREAIEKEYAAFFEQHPGIKIQVNVDSVRLLGSNTAIEDGKTVLTAPKLSGPPAICKYTAIHVKENGKWLMASVRDTRIETASHFHRIADLGWLVGKWTAENQGIVLEAEYRWIANKSFIEKSYQTKQGDHVLTSGKEIIGWDPAIQAIKSWTFNSDGSNAVGLWLPHESGWIVKTVGVMSDGTITGATNVLTNVSESGMSWKSVDRQAGNLSLPETDETILKRQ